MKRAALALGIILASLAVLGAFAVQVLPASLDGTEPEDFPNYYIAGRRIGEGRPVYRDIDTEVEALLGWSGYRAYPADPPATLSLVTPLSALAYPVAWWAMAAVSALVILAVVGFTARTVQLSWWISVALGFAALATNPARFLLRRNHIESLVLLAGFLGWWSWRRGVWRSTGWWWGLAGALKLFPGMWLVGAAGDRKWSIVAWGAASAVIVSAAGVLVVGLDDAWRFLTEVIPRSSRWYGTVGNYSLLSVGAALGGPWLAWTFLALGAAAVLFLYMRRSRGPDRTWVAGTAGALLLSPLSWLNYLVLALPGLVILGDAMDLKRRRERLLLGFLVVTLAWWPPVIRLDGPVVTVLLSSIPTLGLAVLFWLSLTRLPAD